MSGSGVKSKCEKRIFKAGEWHRLSRILESRRAEGCRICFTNGCYDLLHAGHLSLLEKARSLADILVVGINSDKSVERLKGPGRPIVDEKNRARLLAALRMVDYVTVFEEDTPARLIEVIKPDVLVKGQDWVKAGIVGSEFVKARGGKVVAVRLKKGFSTTGLIEKIIRTNRLLSDKGKLI